MFPKSKDHFFIIVILSVCVSVFSITQKQITAKTSNFIFNICIIYRCAILETFNEDDT